MKIERRKNAVSGTFWGIIQKLISILFPFFTRTVFIYVLGVEYLGLSSLFSSILQVLNLSELGFSTVFIFSMFKPIVDDDTDKICALMKLYKECYRMVGLIILGTGLALTPFIPHLINGEVPSDINIYIIYLMNLSSTVLSYWLFAYRNSLFNAHQRNDILSIIGSAVALVTYTLQLICLVEFRNYYLYLSISILSTIVTNVITAMASKKYYPQYSPIGDLTTEEKREIWGQARDLFTAKIGGVVNHSADSIVISAFLGLKILAVYQNYYFITSTVMGFFMAFFAACDAGIANSLIIKNEDENRQLLYNINYCSFAFLNFCVSSLVCLYQPFMELWVGKEYLLDFSMVVLFAVYLIAEIAPRTLVVFKDAGGIWRNDRFRPLVVSCSNLIINITLVNLIGLKGILISTIATLLFIGYPWLMHNVNKDLFNIRINKYLRHTFFYTLVIFASAILSYAVCNLIKPDKLLLTLLFRGIICLFIPNMLFVFLFRNTKEQEYFISLFQYSFLKLRSRSRK